ncbi:MAG: hypothetical protein RLZZ157_1503, partial [Pseudomonadota bacterium]
MPQHCARHPSAADLAHFDRHGANSSRLHSAIAHKCGTVRPIHMHTQTQCTIFWQHLPALGTGEARCRGLKSPMPHDPPTACAIIVAGGTGTRAQGADTASSLPKQYQLLAGKPVIGWSLEAFASAKDIAHIIVVCAPRFRDLIASLAGQTPVLFADAGPSRTASVRAGLAMAATFAPDFVLIHDAARPGLTPRTIADLLTALTQGADGAAPALALADALWE